MINKRSVFTTLVLLALLGNVLFAQDRLIDLNVRGSILMFKDYQPEAGFQDFTTLTPPVMYSVEGVYFLKNYLGIGAFYSGTIVPGEIDPEVYNPGIYYYDEPNEVTCSMYGVTAQVTTSRTKLFRIYGVARMGRAAMAEKFEYYTLGSKGIYYSAGFGVMIKLTRQVSFNLFEVNYNWFPESFSLENDTKVDGLIAQTGVSIRLLRKK